ncbi:MAG: hypothetical protein ACREMP_01635 [Candidatus Tyrphobacter sp.]
MSESSRSTPPEQPWSTAERGGNGYQGPFAANASSSYERVDSDGHEIGKALLFGLLGGIVSAAGYLVYRRLPEEQKDRINAQVRTLVQQRIAELRQNFNI